jgi:hypothetical protein
MIMLFALLYLALCTYYGLFNLKIASFYEFHPNQHTDAFSLLSSATILTRLAPALCINFCALLMIKETAFFHFIQPTT